MPFVAGCARGFLVRMDQQDFRILPGPLGITERMDMQIAEAPAEGQMLDDAHVLVPEEQYLMLQEGIFKGLERRVIDVFGQVDALDFAANDRRERFNFERHCVYRLSDLKSLRSSNFAIACGIH